MPTRSHVHSLAILTLIAALSLSVWTHTADAARHRSGGIVYFSRAAGFNGAFRRPAVIIDGRRIGSIGAGECHAVRLPAGPHVVQVRDETSILSRLGLHIHAKRIFVDNGQPLFITVRPLQEASDFNARETTYNILVSDEGDPC